MKEDRGATHINLLRIFLGQTMQIARPYFTMSVNEDDANINLHMKTGTYEW